MNFFWITLEGRDEKTEVLKKIIQSLAIWPEEKSLYILSLDVLSDSDFTVFFNRITSQFGNSKVVTKEYSIEPLTSQFI